MPNRSRQSGFTLIELMIAVGIVAILAAIALPAYQKFVLRGNRAVVRVALADLAAKQDVYRLKNRAFATTFAPLNGMAASTFYIDRSAVVNTSATAIKAIYKVDINATADSYTLTATPQGNQAKDTDCTMLTLNSVGTRSATGSSSASTACWGR